MASKNSGRVGARMKSRAAAFCLYAILAALAGCATDEHKSTASPAPKRAHAPRYNLVGYSAAFKEGYADACGKRRNAQRMKDDTDYQMGWNDGTSMCRR